MSMRDLDEAFDLMDASDKADFVGPRAESLLASAEKALGLVFPPTYRKFVSNYGCGGIGGFEFYGVNKQDFANSRVPDAIGLTLRDRRSGNLPVSLILVSDTGDGGYYAIDVSQKTPEGDCPVIEWWPGAEDAEGNGRIVASDFGAFLLERVRRALKR